MSMPPALPAGPPVKKEDDTTKTTAVVVAAKPVEPPHQGRHDSKYYCTCPPETFEGHEKISEVQHPKTCPVWQFDDWRNIRCEWDPKKKGWFYTCKCEPQCTEMECKICGVRKYYEKGPWVPVDNGTYGASSWQGSTSTYTPKCRHMEQEVIYPDGTRVFASSELSHDVPKGIPDFALYAYDGWRPRSLATIVPWKDYGLPTCPWPVAAGAIKEAYGLAKEGWSVEVGCAGGHGRTGTILACMAVLSGVPAINAVKWVHEHYCEEAVEGELQEWWVLWFECWHLGIPTPHTLPEKPKPEPIKTTPKKVGSTAPKMLTKAEKKAEKKKAKDAKKVVADALADGSPLTMEQYAEYLKTSPDADDPEDEVTWGDLIGDGDDAAAYLAWQARVAGTSGGATEAMWDEADEWLAQRDAAAAPEADDADPINWHSEDPETEDRWARAWDVIEEGVWPTGETDEEFWERVNKAYDDLCEQDEKGEAAPEGLDTDDEPIEVSGMGIFRSFFGLK